MNPSERLALMGTVGLRLEEKGEFSNMLKELERLKGKVQILERNLNIVTKGTGLFLNTDYHERGVGFSATLSNNHFLRAGEILVFDEILTNPGKSFDVHSGVFVAPKTGKYLFSLTVRAQFHRQVSAAIVQSTDEGEIIIGRVTSGYGGIDRATAAVTVVTKVAAGCRVFVRQIKEKTGDYHGHGCTAFTGVLLD